VIRKPITGQVVNDVVCGLSNFEHLNTNYDLNSSITPAFSTLRTPESLKLKSLLVLGIKYGTGSGKEKAQLMFEVYNDYNDWQLSRGWIA
jgi:hypothetical protein